MQDSESDNNDIDQNLDSSTKMSRIKAAFEDYVPDESYNPDFMESDVIYDENIKTPLSFCYGIKLETITSNCTCNGNGLAIKDIELNRFKSPLEACAIAGELNREPMSHLLFHCNKYASSHLDESNQFCGYKWTNISVVEMYHFLGIILKMWLLFSDVNRYHLLWSPPTYASLLPICQ